MMSVTLGNVFQQSELLELLKQIPGGFKNSRDAFFDDGNKLLKPLVKQGVISFGDEEDLHRRNHVLCTVPSCNKEFDSVFEYESHYNSLHRYLCSQCKKCLPSPHFLDLHLLERHDSYFSVLAERKPMYSCFLEKCKHMSASPEERKDHSIKIHKFPANFRFETSPLANKPKKEKQQPDDDHMDITDVPPVNDQTSVEKMVPKHFSFGHQKQKAFSSKSYAKTLASKQKSVKKSSESTETRTTGALEDSRTVDDLMESLPS